MYILVMYVFAICGCMCMCVYVSCYRQTLTFVLSRKSKRSIIEKRGKNLPAVCNSVCADSFLVFTITLVTNSCLKCNKQQSGNDAQWRGLYQRNDCLCKLVNFGQKQFNSLADRERERDKE